MVAEIYALKPFKLFLFGPSSFIPVSLLFLYQFRCSFYYSVQRIEIQGLHLCILTGGIPCTDVKLNVVNLNKQGKLYNQGMAPVYRTTPGPNHWERVRDRLSFDVSMILTGHHYCLEKFSSHLLYP